MKLYFLHVLALYLSPGLIQISKLSRTFTLAVICTMGFCYDANAIVIQSSDGNNCPPCNKFVEAVVECVPRCDPKSAYCVVFGCSEGATQGGSLLERTYKSPKHRKSSSDIFGEQCPFPAVEISIGEPEMMSLLAVGSKRMTLIADTSSYLMDVGIASEDSQFWVVPMIDFNTAQLAESINPSESPFKDDFPSTNVVFKNVGNELQTVFSHYTVSEDEIILDGEGIVRPQDTFFYHKFETETDFPLQCGTTVESYSNIQLDYNDSIDSTISTKNVVVRATGLLTPINEDPVEAVLSYHEETLKFYFNGEVVDSVEEKVFTWFSVDGHKIEGILMPNSQIEGLAEFVKITYEKSIPACAPAQTLGLDLVASTYRAQDSITSSSAMLNGPVRFRAGNSINLKGGFTTASEFEALITAEPCIED